MQRRNVGGLPNYFESNRVWPFGTARGKNDCSPVIITVKQRQVQHSGGESDTSIKAVLSAAMRLYREIVESALEVVQPPTVKNVRVMTDVRFCPSMTLGDQDCLQQIVWNPASSRASMCEHHAAGIA